MEWIAAGLGYIVAGVVFGAIWGKFLRAGRGMTKAELERHQRQEDEAQAKYLNEYRDNQSK